MMKSADNKLVEGLSVARVVLTNQGAQRIIDTAINAGPVHGIGYWAEWHPTKAKIREHNDSDRAADKGPWITLTAARLSEGCRMALMAGYTLLDDDFDGPTSDVVIQFAALHEQRYG